MIVCQHFNMQNPTLYLSKKISMNNRNERFEYCIYIMAGMRDYDSPRYYVLKKLHKKYLTVVEVDYCHIFTTSTVQKFR